MIQKSKLTLLSKGMHWIYPSIGRVIFGFGNSAATDTFFTIVIDAFPAVSISGVNNRAR